MVVLVADAFEKSGIGGLTAAGCEVIHDPSLDGEALAAALRHTRADVLVVRSTKVTAAMMDAGALALVVGPAPATTPSMSPRRRRAGSMSRIARAAMPWRLPN
jgi:phosphoglycerate dehydrogenase-like enzyme